MAKKSLKNLTPVKQDVLDIIIQLVARYRTFPTLQEILDQTHHKSRSSINQCIGVLRKHGYIVQHDSYPRGSSLTAKCKIPKQPAIRTLETYRRHLERTGARGALKLLDDYIKLGAF